MGLALGLAVRAGGCVPVAEVVVAGVAWWWSGLGGWVGGCGLGRRGCGVSADCVSSPHHTVSHTCSLTHTHTHTHGNTHTHMALFRNVAQAT